MTGSMNYDLADMDDVTAGVTAQLRAFTTTLDNYRTTLTNLSSTWQGGAATAAKDLGDKLEKQGLEIGATVTRYVKALNEHRTDSAQTEQQNLGLFNG